MKSATLIALAAALALTLTPGAESLAAESGNLVMVVYNKRLSASKEVAAHYARVRRVPDSQGVGFDLTLEETMTRAEFQSRLQRPLFDYLRLLGLFQPAPNRGSSTNTPAGGALAGASVRYLVLCHGVPLKIQADSSLVEAEATNLPPALRRNDAAVDSELTWLPASREKATLAGPALNPFYGATNLAAMHPTNNLLLVSRLDGPTPEIARGLVDKAMQAEANGLWGRAYFDLRGLTNGEYAAGDQMLRSAAMAAAKMGFETVADESPQPLPPEFPFSQAALYAGWYDNHVSGPLARPQAEFMPGAFAYHLHSYSAATLRSATRNWAGPLLARGAAATVGYVEEPYLQFTSDTALLIGLLLHRGASFGEAAWAAERTLSWQTTVVGDPLYRPCATPLQILHARLEQAANPLVEWSHLLVVNRNLLLGATPAEMISYLAQIPATEKSAVLTEKLGDLQRQTNGVSEALGSYRNALDRKPSPQQAVRLLVTVAEMSTAAGRDTEAAAAWKRLLLEHPDHPVPPQSWPRIRAAAEKAGDADLISRCEAGLKDRGAPGSPPTNAPAKGPAGT